MIQFYNFQMACERDVVSYDEADTVEPDEILIITVDENDQRSLFCPLDVPEVSVRRSVSARKCWNCDRVGHQRKFCPLKRQKDKVIARRKCYLCKRKGHICSQCPYLNVK